MVMKCVFGAAGHHEFGGTAAMTQRLEIAQQYRFTDTDKDTLVADSYRRRGCKLHCYR